VRRKRVKTRVKSLKCFFCEKEALSSYKEPDILRRFVSERGKILSRSRTGVCSKHQRRLAREIKRARHLAMLFFVAQV